MSRRKAPSLLSGTSSLFHESIDEKIRLSSSDELADNEKYDDDIDDDGSDHITPLLSLRVKSNNKPDQEIHVPPTMNISDVKDVVRRKALGWNESQDRYLRLVCKGKLLAPDSALLEEFQVRTGDVVHAILAAAGVKGGQQAAIARGWTTGTTVALPTGSDAPAPPSTTRRYRGTVIGPGGRMTRAPEEDGEDEIEEEEDNENYSDDDDPNDLQNGRHRGLDRLRATHQLSRTEIRALRIYFRRDLEQHGADMRRAAGTDLESDPMPRWRIEDSWMEAQGPLSEFRLNISRNNPEWNRLTTRTRSVTGRPATAGTDRDFVWGFITGFILGFFALLCVWSPHIPQRRKVGILMGISFKISLSLLGEDSSDGKDGNDNDDGDDYGYLKFALPGEEVQQE